MFKKNTLFFIILLAFVLRSGFVLFYFDEHKFYGYEYGTNDTHKPIGDDQRYIEIAMNLIEGNGFPVIYETPPHSQDFRRGPLYLLFLASIFKVFGFSVLSICFIQALLSSLSIYFIYKIADYYFGIKTALMASLIWAVYPATILWTMTIYRETLTIFLILWTTWRFIRLKNEQTWKNAVASGIGLSLILLQDPFTQVLVPVYLLFLWFTPQIIDPLRKSIYVYLRGLSIHAKIKLLLSGLVIGTSILLLSPWLIYTNSVIGRPVIATAGEFGIMGNYFQYFGLQIARKQNKNLTELEYSKSVTKERFLIASKYLGLDNFAVSNLTVDQKNQLLDTLKQNSAFISELDSFHFRETVRFLFNDPQIYFGQPFGKLIVVKFFGYWMNLAVNYQERPHPNISTLYLITNSDNFFVKSTGVLSLLFSLFLFIVYLKYALKAKLLFFLWLPYFMFFNIFVFRSEPRYVLPVLAFNIIILAEALRAMLDSNKKTSAGTGIKIVQE